MEAYEAAHPEAVWPVVEECSGLHLAPRDACLDDDPFADFIPPAPQKEIPTEDPEFFPAYDVLRQLDMSPTQFVDMLDGLSGRRLITSKEDEYRQSGKNNPFKIPDDGNFFTTSMIKDLTIHRKDLQEYLDGRSKPIYVASDGDEGLDRSVSCGHDYDELKSKLTESLAECGRLSEALEKAQARIAELETAATEPQPLTPTRAATQARQEKALESWLPSVDAMIKVAIMCGVEGDKLRQQPDLNVMFNELDAVLTDRQMKFFRKCLPDKHIDRAGGDKRKV